MIRRISFLLCTGVLLSGSAAFAEALLPEASAAVQPNGDSLLSKARVIDVGPHSRTWLVRERQVGSNNDKHSIQTGRVVELETGMHFWNGQQWSPSEPAFHLVNGAFVADKVQHPSSLAAENINVVGAVKTVTPDGSRLSSTPLAIALMDPVTAEVTIIANIKDSAGVLVSSNQVVYPDAFDGVSADIVYTLDKNSFSQDVVITARVNPEDFGFSTNSQLQVISEFYDGPEPGKTRRPLRVEKDQRIRSKMASPDFVDSELNFGDLVFAQGKAYTAADTNSDDGVLAAKDFITVEGGRRFLIESVEFPTIENAIKALPENDGNTPHAINTTRKLNSKRAYASISQPAQQGARAQAKSGKKLERVASLAFDRTKPGVVIDYHALIATDCTLNSGVTYYVNGSFVCSGPFVVNGGAIVKFKTDASITLNGTVTCNTGPYDPAIFTAIKDDSVGECLQSVDPTAYSQASLVNGCANPALCLKYPNSVALNNLWFAYCKLAINLLGSSSSYVSTTLAVSDSQLVNCVQGVSISISSGGCGAGGAAAMNISNSLFDNVKSAVLMNSPATGFAFTGNLTHCTISKSQYLFSQSCGCGAQLNIKNSILAGTTAWSSIGAGGRAPVFSGLNNGFYNNGQIGTIGTGFVNATTSPFVPSGCATEGNIDVTKPGGAGAYYLLDNSNFRDAGTTAIDAAILADIAKKTTLAPVLLNTVNSADVTLSPNPKITDQPRILADSDVHPDLGYHYDIIDYMTWGYTINNAALTIDPGTTIGSYYHDAICLSQSTRITCLGEPNHPIRFVDYLRVQEQPLEIGRTYALPINCYRTTPEFKGTSAQFRFTEFKRLFGPRMAPNYSTFYTDDSHLFNPLSVRDCSFTGSAGISLWAAPTEGSYNFFNNVFAGDFLTFGNSDQMTFCNNLVKNGSTMFAGPSLVKNNAFDSSDIEDWIGDGTVVHDHNAYINTPSQDFPSSAANGDVTLSSFTYGTGPLGRYYQVSTGLKDKGSCTANTVGLFHYTTQLDQTKEETSTVDIGYHAVAADTAGNPIDTDGYIDAAGHQYPDWQADSNGNGLYDLTELGDFNSSSPVKFRLDIANEYVNTPNVTLGITLAEDSGVPTRMAVWVDPVLTDDGFPTSPIWMPYASTINRSLGNTGGWHSVWVLVARRDDDPSPRLEFRRFNLDTSTPQLVITSPSGTDVTQPLVQIIGYCAKSLASLTCAVVNGNGTQKCNALITDRTFDESVGRLTTTRFQVYDVALTPGTNTVTFDAVDVAGNTGRTVLNYRVLASAPAPTISVTWPKDNMNLGGTTFTIDGKLNDATATVIATVSDSSGTVVGTFDGLVERGGRFWVEDLPLSSGINHVTITARDPWKSSSPTNVSFTVTKKPVTVAVVLPNELYCPTVKLTGTVSDSTYTVWVNGVPASPGASGSGSWEATAVPVPNGPTATFNVTAYAANHNPSTSSGQPFTNPSDTDSVNQYFEQDKTSTTTGQDVISFRDAYVDTMNESVSTSQKSSSPQWTMSESCNWGQNWTDGQSLYAWSYRNNTDSAGNKTGHSWEGGLSPLDGPLKWPNVNSLSINWTGTQTDGQRATYDPIASEYCSVSSQKSGDGFSSTYKRSAVAKMKFCTGGKPVAGRNNIFTISAPTYRPTDVTTKPPYSTYFDCVSVRPETVAISGYGNLGTDGNLFVALPDGEALDITPNPSGQNFYFFDEHVQKHCLSIKANGYLLFPTKVFAAKFCVGQKVPFEVTFDPALPSVSRVSGKWSLGGNFVNDSSPAGTKYVPDGQGGGYWTGFGSTDYYKNDGKLNVAKSVDPKVKYGGESTYAWWDGSVGNNEDKTASINLTLFFVNGQTVSVTPMGLFNMYRPNPTWYPKDMWASLTWQSLIVF